MPSGESAAHLELKRLAFAWARARGHLACATEVSLPHAGYRADAAACRLGFRGEWRPDTVLARPRRVTVPAMGSTMVFECKQARSDFLKDSRQINATLRRLEELHARRVTMEEWLRLHWPGLHAGDSLFAEYATCDFSQAKYPAYRKLMAGICRLQNRLYGKTKFERLLRARAAEFHYLVVEPGILKAHETPAGWGLLMRQGTLLETVVEAPAVAVTPENQLLLLYRIAVSWTKSQAATLGLPWEYAAGKELLQPGLVAHVDAGRLDPIPVPPELKANEGEGEEGKATDE